MLVRFLPAVNPIIMSMKRRGIFVMIKTYFYDVQHMQTMQFSPQVIYTGDPALVCTVYWWEYGMWILLFPNKSSPATTMHSLGPWICKDWSSGKSSYNDGCEPVPTRFKIEGRTGSTITGWDSSTRGMNRMKTYVEGQWQQSLRWLIGVNPRKTMQTTRRSIHLLRGLIIDYIQTDSLFVFGDSLRILNLYLLLVLNISSLIYSIK